jgi:peptidoglycan/LPS O-acetylase OafA/YrhL
MPNTSEFNRKYFPALDGLRAVAILMVLVHHLGGYIGSFFDAGYYGVDLFFVISGYLITSILVSSKGRFPEAYKTFLGRRTLRIFPIYYLTLAVLYAFNVGATRKGIVYLCTYTWNYARHLWDGSQIHYLWSLSVEEQFYLFWPVVALLLRERMRLLLCLTIVVIAVGYAQLTMNLFPSLAPFNYTGLINRMGSLGLGAFGAVVLCLCRIPNAVYRSVSLEAAVLSVLVWTQATGSKLRFPLMGVCSLFLVLKAVRGEIRIWGFRQLLDSELMQSIGRVSYGIYLYHIPVALLAGAWIVDPIWFNIPFDELGMLSKLRWHSWILKLPLFSGITILLAMASYRWIEKPILACKDLWFPPQQTQAEAA